MVVVGVWWCCFRKKKYPDKLKRPGSLPNFTYDVVTKNSRTGSAFYSYFITGIQKNNNNNKHVKITIGLFVKYIPYFDNYIYIF